MLLFLCLCYPGERNSVHRVDVAVVEENHCYDEHGHHVFDQLIFWDWYPELSQHHVSAWILLKDDMPRTSRDHRKKTRVTRIITGVGTYEIYSRSYRETWTQYDPELLDRANIPREKRPKILDRQDWWKNYGRKK